MFSAKIKPNVGAPRETLDPPLVGAESSTIKRIENQETGLFVLRSHFLNFLPTAGEGNVFTHVCLSTGERVGGSEPRGVPAWRPPGDHCSGRYASYWNVFSS